MVVRTDRRVTVTFSATC